jgi:dipeptidyl-peptidase-4
MSRSQQHARVLAVDVSGDGGDADGTCITHVRRESRDDSWIEVAHGAPTWTPDGRLLTVEAVGGATSVLIDARPVTDETVQVRAVLDVSDDGALLAVSPTAEPTQQHVVRLRWPAPEPSPDAPAADAADRPLGVVSGITAPSDATPLEALTSQGYGSGAAGGGTLVTVTADWERPARADVRSSDGTIHVVASHASDPVVTPAPTVVRSRTRGIVTAVYLPSGHVAGSRKLPVLMSPYGGPHAQRVVAARNAHLESQWLADQGFAVVVADGRGTPRTPSWERAVRGDLAGPVLDDQVEALQAAAEHVADLDLSRVGIRGWSFGGYLAALAVLRRPDVFHAAVAGAPVTDWALYDTFYTERYLGRPDETSDALTGGAAYARSSIVDDAHLLTRPLMLVHGLADDNVVAAHTLRFSSALLAAGRPHTVLPLSGVTHMTPQEVVAENLLLLQVAFLKEHLIPHDHPA